MAAIVSVGDIERFYNENLDGLSREFRLVADEKDYGVEIYITDNNGLPYFAVEVDGVIEYGTEASSVSEIEKVYSQLLNFYICETDTDEFFALRDISRLKEIYKATFDYLSALLECEPDEFFDNECIEEIALAFEDYLYDAYGVPVRHPIVDKDRVINYPFPCEV